MGQCVSKCSKKKHTINRSPLARVNIDAVSVDMWKEFTQQEQIEGEDLQAMFRKIGVETDSYQEFYFAYMYSLKQLAVLTFEEFTAFNKE